MIVDPKTALFLVGMAIAVVVFVVAAWFSEPTDREHRSRYMERPKDMPRGPSTPAPPAKCIVVKTVEMPAACQAAVDEVIKRALARP